MKKIFAVTGLLALIVSCTPKVNVANEPIKTTDQQLAQGKTIFENTCGKCHKLPDPTSHNSVDWVGIMNRMAPKAKLTDEQHQWVYDYIVSVKK